MEEQEAMALTRAYTTLRDELHHLALQELPGHVSEDCFTAERYTTLRDELHHLALQELPGHVSEDCFTAERDLVRASWQKWLVEE